MAREAMRRLLREGVVKEDGDVVIFTATASPRRGLCPKDVFAEFQDDKFSASDLALKFGVTERTASTYLATMQRRKIVVRSDGTWRFIASRECDVPINTLRYMSSDKWEKLRG